MGTNGVGATAVVVGQSIMGTNGVGATAPNLYH